MNKGNDEKKFYGMMNDYMFHLVLQESEKVLTGLVSALMDIPLEEIRQCRVENPIDYGSSIEDKEIILDVRLSLNDDTNIDIEVQVNKHKYWIERSLLYWARTYGRLNTGEEYGKLKTTYHIGILQFTLFEDEPEFYAEYGLYNKKNGRQYTDKICIRTLDITRPDLADDSQKEQNLLKWANAFKAKTLPELEKLCKGEEVLEEMAVIIKKLSEDEKIRMRCEAREDYDRWLRTQYCAGKEEGFDEGHQKGAEEERARSAAEIRRYQQEIAELRKKLAERS